MRFKPRSIAITSGKGGTGKTTLTANLGVALGALGKDTTILDGDLAMANLAIVLGMHKCERSFLDALTGEAEVKDVIYRNYGIKVVPMGFRFEDAHEVLTKVKRDRVEEIIGELLRQTEFLLIDGAAGIQDATIISIAAAREMIPVCNPTYTSLVDAYKIVRLANVLGSWTRGVVVNRTGKRADLSTEEVETFMSRALGAMPILSEIPEDPKVQEAELAGIPVVVYEPDCEASVTIGNLAKLVAGEANLPYVPYEERAIAETTARLVRALTGRTI
ncbi:MAG: cell division ATPase MinD [Candidatus Hadarchaeum sp.]|uniref:cell division ATPase MinD n=1 Tax=Candidatus Hadarchaeum sp. TaxID=2883567 RepID=UPI003D0D8927